MGTRQADSDNASERLATSRRDRSRRDRRAEGSFASFAGCLAHSQAGRDLARRVGCGPGFEASRGLWTELPLPRGEVAAAVTNRGGMRHRVARASSPWRWGSSCQSSGGGPRVASHRLAAGRGAEETEVMHAPERPSVAPAIVCALPRRRIPCPRRRIQVGEPKYSAQFKILEVRSTGSLVAPGTSL